MKTPDEICECHCHVDDWTGEDSCPECEVPGGIVPARDVVIPPKED